MTEQILRATLPLKLKYFRSKVQAHTTINRLWWKYMTGPVVVSQVFLPSRDNVWTSLRYSVIMAELENRFGENSWSYKIRCSSSGKLTVTFRKGLSKEAMLFALRWMK